MVNFSYMGPFHIINDLFNWFANNYSQAKYTGRNVWGSGYRSTSFTFIWGSLHIRGESVLYN